MQSAAKKDRKGQTAQKNKETEEVESRKGRAIDEESSVEMKESTVQLIDEAKGK